MEVLFIYCLFLILGDYSSNNDDNIDDEIPIPTNYKKFKFENLSNPPRLGQLSSFYILKFIIY